MTDNSIKISAKESLSKNHFHSERKSQFTAKGEYKGLRREQIKSLILHYLWVDPPTYFCDVVSLNPFKGWHVLV